MLSRCKIRNLFPSIRNRLAFLNSNWTFSKDIVKFVGPKPRLERKSLLFHIIIKVMIIKLAIPFTTFLISSNLGPFVIPYVLVKPKGRM